MEERRENRKKGRGERERGEMDWKRVKLTERRRGQEEEKREGKGRWKQKKLGMKGTLGE